MIKPIDFYQTLQKRNINFFVGVPDSLLKDICAYITDNTLKQNNIISANEGNAIGIATGYHLATKKLALAYMQNSGLGNAINPLLSLADQKVYSIPMLLLIGWRGEPNIKDEPQHIKQGEITCQMLEVSGIFYEILDLINWQIQLNKLLDIAIINNRPVALLVKKNSFAKYSLQNKIKNNYVMSREQALKTILDNLNLQQITVATTGKLSRELFEYREKNKQSHAQDFLTVGSMGHCSSISLGIVLNSKKTVFCFDGDGSMLMHTGIMANIASLKSNRFIHILFNNGIHESVGGQPTEGFNIDIKKIAEGFGYQSFSVDNQLELINFIKNINQNIANNKPVLLEIKINSQVRKELGRPTKTPLENKNSFVKYLNK